MKSNWRVYTKKADFKAIGERFGIDQVMARIIRNRGLETDEQINMYLNGTVDDMHSPHLLKDADKCVDIQSIRNLHDFILFMNHASR